MKKSIFKTVAALILSALTVFLFACAGPGTVDPSNNSPGDVSDDPAATDGPGAEPVNIIKDGVTEYRIVKDNVNSRSNVNSLDLLAGNIKKTGADVSVEDAPGTASKQIKVSYSPDYKDSEGGVLTYAGYRIFVDGEENVNIVAGSEDSMNAALSYFGSLIEGKSLVLPAGYEYSYHPFLLRTGVTVAGRDIAGFNVKPVSGDALTELASGYIRKLLFTYFGEYLAGAEDSAPAISFEYTADAADTTGSVKVTDSGITVTGNARIGFYRVFRDFILQADADIPAGTEFNVNYGEFVTYEDFGAAGDGETDDSKAILDAHNEANGKGIPVLTREGATYYIGKSSKLVKIKTDTDWSCSHFIIDDSKVTNVSQNVFSVPTESKSTSIKKEVTKLDKAQPNIGVTLPAKSIVIATNTGVMQYIRKGANQNSGTAMKDIFLVDESGNVDPGTPIVWDFKKVSSITYRPVDDAPLTIDGGIFTTVANQAKSEYTYYGRGIDITRSNVLVQNVAHYITGEGETGAPYSGFLMISDSYKPTVRNCILTPHFTYYTVGSGKSITPMGSYECQVTNTIDLTFEGVIQSKSINDVFYWGVFASNFSRNMNFKRDIISRFDAHMGVSNVNLLDCTFGHQGINLIGFGTALIDGCTVFAKNIINLRDDYGSTWNGDVVIRNSVYYPMNGSKASAALIGGNNTYDHNFGYTCYLPRHVTIENLFINDSNPLIEGANPTVFGNINPEYNSDSYKGKYPMEMTESVTAKGVTTYSGMALIVADNTYMFGGVQLTLGD